MGGKLQISSTKFQTIIKIPIFKYTKGHVDSFVILVLGFGICLGFGIWNLGFIS